MDQVSHELEKPALYKVLKNGKSIHGGDLSWSLPAQDDDGYAPGEWHGVTKRPIVCCRNGIHLTTEPMKWAVANMEVYLAEGRGERATDGTDKTAFAEGRLLRPAPEVVPAWWQSSMSFINHDIPGIAWLKPDGAPDPSWKLFTAPTLAAAGDAAWEAARHAARNAAGDAAGDAAWAAAGTAARHAAWDAAGDAAGDAAWAASGDARLYTLTEHICGDVEIDQAHRDHVRARWTAWQKGYAVLCDVDGVLYCYAAEDQS